MMAVTQHDNDLMLILLTGWIRSASCRSCFHPKGGNKSCDPEVSIQQLVQAEGCKPYLTKFIYLIIFPTWKSANRTRR